MQFSRLDINRAAMNINCMWKKNENLYKTAEAFAKAAEESMNAAAKNVS